MYYYPNWGSVMRDSWYDSVPICANGHVINAASMTYLEDRASFCARCGAPLLDRCLECHAPIRSAYLAGPFAAGSSEAPAYCDACGHAFPWTEARIEVAQQLVDELVMLTEIERDLLKQSIDELVEDGPHAPGAILKFKHLVGKAGKEVAESLREILVDIVSEAVYKAIWG